MQELCMRRSVLCVHSCLGKPKPASGSDEQPAEALGLIALAPRIDGIRLARLQQVMERYLAPWPPSGDLQERARTLPDIGLFVTVTCASQLSSLLRG